MNPAATPTRSPGRAADTSRIAIEELIPLTLMRKVMNLLVFKSSLQGRRATAKAVGLFYRLAYVLRPARPAKRLELSSPVFGFHADHKRQDKPLVDREGSD